MDCVKRDSALWQLTQNFRVICPRANRFAPINSKPRQRPCYNIHKACNRFTKKLHAAVFSKSKVFCGVFMTFTQRFLSNRLTHITCYLLNIDLALNNPLLLCEVKFNKSGNTFFAIKFLFHVHDIIQLVATFGSKSN